MPPLKTTRRGYECKHPWPENCKVQSGGSGLVFRDESKGGSYNTAFFEAFPRSPSTFIRGEGASIEDAESQAYRIFQTYQACDHDYERLSDDGRGRCLSCGMTNRRALINIQHCDECGDLGAPLKHPEQQGGNLCQHCLIGDVGDRVLARPLAEPDRSKTSRASRLEPSDARLAAPTRVLVMAVRRLAKCSDFQALSQHAQHETVEVIEMMAGSLISRERAVIVGLVINYFPHLDTIRFLDDAAYFRIICESEEVLWTAAKLACASWQNYANSKSMETDEIIPLRSEFLGSLLPEIHRTLEHWQMDPPVDGQMRQRISTREEMKAGIMNAMEALAKA